MVESEDSMGMIVDSKIRASDEDLIDNSNMDGARVKFVKGVTSRVLVMPILPRVSLGYAMADSHGL